MCEADIPLFKFQGVRILDCTIACEEVIIRSIQAWYIFLSNIFL